jgi:hypothetical protein
LIIVDGSAPQALADSDLPLAGRIGIMPKYRAIVHVSGLTGENPRVVRSEIDEQLRKSGLENCQVVSIDLDLPVATRRRVNEAVESLQPPASRAGGFLLVAAATWALLFFCTWALLFFWWMLSAAPE